VTRDELTYLRSADGLALLRAARDVSGDSLKRQMVLRRDYPADRVRSAVALLDLRIHARSKFKHADVMFFDRDGLEQSSGDVIAEYRAKRYASHDRVTDVCCGIGGDSVALAHVASVTAVDIRSDRVQMTRANLEVNGLTASFACVDARDWQPKGEAFFVDPSRREGGRHVFNLKDYSPSLDELSWLTPDAAAGVKVAPGIPHQDIPDGYEAEFISVDRDCKEAVLWSGALRSHDGVRATLLPGGDTLVGQPVDAVGCRPVGAFVFEPDRAVIRAHLVEQVAHLIGAEKLAPDVAYLTSDHEAESPFVRGFRVDAAMPFSLKRVQGYIKAQQIGRIDIKKRRFPMTADAVYGKLKLKGSAATTLILTRVADDPVAIFTTPIDTP